MCVFNTLFFDLDWVLGHKMNALGIFGAAIFPAFLVMQVLSMRFVYWDVDDEGICEHRFGRRKIVKFSEILKVTGRAEWSAKPSLLKIECVSSEEPSKQSRIYPAPANMDAFVDLLRRCASSADIAL